MRSTDPGDDPISTIEPVTVRSAEQEVYEALRRDIIGGLPPGTPLRLTQLADRFKVSTMPIRSAIARLEADGLVVQRPRRGAVVTELTVADMQDLYAIRTALEGVAARCGCIELTEQQIQEMRACQETLATIKLEHAADIDRYLATSRQLHDICYEAANRPRLVQLVQVYRRQGERYFRRYLGIDLEVAIDVVHQRDLLTACELRDPDRAEAATRALLEYTVQRLLPGLTAGTVANEESRRHDRTSG